ncbi:hypothetical protein, conserved [Eimeria praecox]|uniref:Uncharacterized protein n=1 Tax=Eimeria praecox TaxID=51316 RepID=U6G2T5_9EIME|nr:hypothetical protein, conserved [Eimeria praecox]
MHAPHSSACNAYSAGSQGIETCQGSPSGGQEVLSPLGGEAEPVGMAAAAAAPAMITAAAAASAAAAAAEGAEEVDNGECSCDFMEGANSDMSEPWMEDGEAIAADVITSASASWCAHEAAAEAEADALASFFAQLASSHSLTEGATAEDVEGLYDPLDAQESFSECAHNSNLIPEEECPKAGPFGFPAEVTVKAEDAGQQRRQPGDEDYGAGSGSRRMRSAYLGKTVADTIDPELRAYFAASLKRDHFPCILGSLREAILSSPEIFGFYNADGSGEAEAAAGRPLGGQHRGGVGAHLADGLGRRAGADLQQQQRQQQQQPTAVAAAIQVAEEGGKRADDLRLLGECDEVGWLLPPAVSVSGDFCRVNPRVAVRWMVHTQMENMLEGEHLQQPLQQQQPQQQRTIEGSQCSRFERTWAQLACLVPPKALCSKPEAAVNRAREEVHLAAARLAKGLDSEQMHALKYLLQTWYFSGFFTGQLQATASGG